MVDRWDAASRDGSGVMVASGRDARWSDRCTRLDVARDRGDGPVLAVNNGEGGGRSSGEDYSTWMAGLSECASRFGPAVEIEGAII